MNRSLALALWLALACTPAAQAVVYTAEVSDFSVAFGTCSTPPLDAETNATGAHAFAELTPPSNGEGTASADAEAGALFGELDLFVETGGSSSIAGCFDPEMEIDDIVISGPGTLVTTTVAIDVEGLYGFVSENSQGRSFRATVTLSGTNSVGGTTSTFRTTGNLTDSYSNTLVTDPITVDIAEPLTVVVTLHGQASGQAPGGTSADVFADWQTYFTLDGDVFDLPTGYTANSDAGKIFDNQYLPEPGRAPALLAGTFLLAGLRRSRNASTRRRR